MESTASTPGRRREPRRGPRAGPARGRTRSARPARRGGGTGRDLRAGFLTRGHDRATTRRHRDQPLQQQGRLADPGRPGEQHDGPRHETAPQHRVELPEVRGTRGGSAEPRRRAAGPTTRPQPHALGRRAGAASASIRPHSPQLHAPARPSRRRAARRPRHTIPTLVFPTATTLDRGSDTHPTRPG